MMMIGVRKVGEMLIFFGWDGLGSLVHPEVGIDGYNRVLGIIEDRRRKAGRASHQPVLDPTEVDPTGFMPDGHSLVERLSAEGSTFMAYDTDGEPLADNWLPDAQSAYALHEAAAPSSRVY